jgi:hypothetical protein
MNQATYQIMNLLEVDSKAACKVQARMSQNGLDFSECTTREFNASAKQALEIFDKANVALKNGDFGKYGELQAQLRKLLSQLATKP